MSFDIYLSPPHMGGDEIRLLQSAFASNWIAPVGPYVDAFEASIEERLGNGVHVCAVSSGTAALHLALLLLDIRRGDTVLCSSFTFVGSANPILYQGAAPALVDSEPGSWNMSPAALDLAISRLRREGVRPKAAIVANLYGQSSDMMPIVEICERSGIPIIEDAAESLGATYEGRESGTFGEFGILSFNGNKIITTSGGGALVCRTREAAQRARFLATQARDPAAHYQHSQVGYNYRLSNLLAAVGVGQMRMLNCRVEARRKVFDQYRAALNRIPGVAFMPEADFGRSTRWLSVMTLEPDVTGTTPLELVTALASHRIESRLVWKPLHLQPLFDGVPFFTAEENEPFAERCFRVGVCLPSGSALTCAQVEEIVSRIVEHLSARHPRNTLVRQVREPSNGDGRSDESILPMVPPAAIGMIDPERGRPLGEASAGGMGMPALAHFDDGAANCGSERG